MMRIGIVGGLGPEATIDYYREIIDLYRDKTHGSLPAIIIFSLESEHSTTKPSTTTSTDLITTTTSTQTTTTTSIQPTTPPSTESTSETLTSTSTETSATQGGSTPGWSGYYLVVLLGVYTVIRKRKNH